MVVNLGESIRRIHENYHKSFLEKILGRILVWIFREIARLISEEIYVTWLKYCLHCNSWVKSKKTPFLQFFKRKNSPKFMKSL